MRIDRNREYNYNRNMEYGQNKQKTSLFKIRLILLLIVIFTIVCGVIKYGPYFIGYNGKLTTEVTLQLNDKQSKYIDISAFEVNSDGKCSDNNSLVYYNNRQNKNESIVYLTQSHLGFSGLVVNKDNVSKDTQRIDVYCTIYKDSNIDFDNIRLKVNDKDISGLFNFKFDLSDRNAGGTYSRKTLIDECINNEYKALKVCEIIRKDDSWETKVIMEYSNDDLQDICGQYGLLAEYR